MQDKIRPCRSTEQVNFMGPLAQSVEQQTFNLWVVGSIPTGPTGNLELHRVNAKALLCMRSKPEELKFCIG